MKRIQPTSGKCRLTSSEGDQEGPKKVKQAIRDIATISLLNMNSLHNYGKILKVEESMKTSFITVKKLLEISYYRLKLDIEFRDRREQQLGRAWKNELRGGSRGMIVSLSR